MELPGVSLPRSQSQWASSNLSPTRDPRRYLLCGPQRLCLAAVATRFPVLEDRLPLLPSLALGWHLGEDARCLTQACAGAHEARSRAQRRRGGQPVDQDDRRGWVAARLRRSQEGQRAQAASVGRHAGLGAKRASTAQRSKTARASSSCWRSTRGIISPDASLTCGWTLATPEKTRVRTGYRRRWDGRLRSCDTYRSWLRMK